MATLGFITQAFGNREAGSVSQGRKPFLKCWKTNERLKGRDNGCEVTLRAAQCKNSRRGGREQLASLLEAAGRLLLLSSLVLPSPPLPSFPPLSVLLGSPLNHLFSYTLAF